MKAELDLQTLRDAAWRRPLTAAENTELKRLLTASPDAAQDWHLEQQLSRVLVRRAAAPMPSNFTAQVLQAVARETATPRRSPSGWSWLRGWVPRLAFASLVLGVSVFGFHRYEVAGRQRMADSVAAISAVSSLPAPELLADFDAICRLGNTPPADTELLRLLQ